MTEYEVGQVVKGTRPPSQCPDGCYWRKIMGEDAFKLYPRMERKAGVAPRSESDEPRLTVNRIAEGIRSHMQHEEGFKRVMEAANLSAKALQNLAAWSHAAAVSKAEQEKVRTTALSKANAALRDAGLMIGPDGTVQPIPTT